jgi:hypothetical protein
MVDDIQRYDSMNIYKSLLSPILINPLNPMFTRYDDVDESNFVTPACPLSNNTELEFRQRSDSIPPSPYSDNAVEILDVDQETSHDDQNNHSYSKKRRYSDEPRRPSFKGSRRRESFSGHHEYKRSRY